MAEVAEEYVFALSRALVQARVLPSAVDDITVRIMRDRPVDIGGYVQSLQTTLPSYFAKTPEAAPVEPAPGDVGYDTWLLRNLEHVAGPSMQTAAAEQGELTSGKGEAVPKVIRGDDPAYDKLFRDHLTEIASGQMTAERKQ